MTEYAGIEEAVREIVSRVVLQIEEEHAKHLTEELRIQSRQLDAYAARIAELEAALREAYEVYAGSDGFIPETAAEGYQQQLISEMVAIIGAELKK